MMGIREYSRIGLAVVASLGLAACDDDPTSDENGTISMYLTDAPGDFTRAIVTIDRVELLGDDGEAGVIVLRDEAFTGDLLELSNDVVELVDERVVPGGTYHQIRFVISGGCVEVETEDGTEVHASDGYLECGPADGSLQMPSFESSGLKVNLPSGFSISNEQRIVLVDFDVAESFGHGAGNSGKWVMHPVIHATEIEVTGTLDVDVVLADTVTLPEPFTVDSFTVRLNEEPAVQLSDGDATFLYLVPGSYSVDLISPDGTLDFTTDPAEPVVVQIGSGAEASLTLTVTSVF